MMTYRYTPREERSSREVAAYSELRHSYELDDCRSWRDRHNLAIRIAARHHLPTYAADALAEYAEYLWHEL